MPPMDGLRKILESYANHKISIPTKKNEKNRITQHAVLARKKKNVNSYRTNKIHIKKLKFTHEI
jgi:hypothetical protein